MNSQQHGQKPGQGMFINMLGTGHVAWGLPFQQCLKYYQACPGHQMLWGKKMWSCKGSADCCTSSQNVLQHAILWQSNVISQQRAGSRSSSSSRISSRSTNTPTVSVVESQPILWNSCIWCPMCPSYDSYVVSNCRQTPVWMKLKVKLHWSKYSWIWPQSHASCMQQALVHTYITIVALEAKS
jgi:hypothetical protein